MAWDIYKKQLEAYPPGKGHISHLGKGKIIDSKVVAWEKDYANRLPFGGSSPEVRMLTSNFMDPPEILHSFSCSCEKANLEAKMDQGSNEYMAISYGKFPSFSASVSQVFLVPMHFIDIYQTLGMRTGKRVKVSLR